MDLSTTYTVLAQYLKTAGGDDLDDLDRDMFYVCQVLYTGISLLLNAHS